MRAGSRSSQSRGDRISRSSVIQRGSVAATTSWSTQSALTISTRREVPMDITALLLSRIQFAFTISFHIIFPAFTIGLAAWLTVLDALHLLTARPVYRVLFDFWLKIFGVAFGLGVVSGVVMAFEFGTNWSVLSKMSGPIQGPLLLYETFPAFALEASVFCVAATGAWYLLRTIYHAEAKVMLAMGLGLAAVLLPIQLFFGHLNGEYVAKHQPSKMAAIEARWNDEKPASEVLLAWPDEENQ